MPIRCRIADQSLVAFASFKAGKDVGRENGLRRESLLIVLAVSVLGKCTIKELAPYAFYIMSKEVDLDKIRVRLRTLTDKGFIKRTEGGFAGPDARVHYKYELTTKGEYLTRAFTRRLNRLTLHIKDVGRK